MTSRGSERAAPSDGLPTRTRIEKGNQEIRSVDDWFRLAPPKRGEHHWQDGRSAKELARAYFCNDGGEDLNRFVHWLTNGRVESVPVGKLVGPLSTSGVGDVPHLHIGKVSADVRAPADSSANGEGAQRSSSP